MRVLIQRELEEMRVSADRKESLLTVGFASFLAILFLFFLGPAFFDIFDTYGITSIVTLAGIGFVGMLMNASLQEDSHQRQIAFLQILPITKTWIVHAKFLSILIKSGSSCLWMLAFVSLNVIVNGTWSIAYLMAVLLAVSIIWLLVAENLLRYYFWGYRKRSGGMYVVSVVAWVVLFLYGLNVLLGSRETPLWIITLFILSPIVYGICWILAVQRVQKRGFPREVEQPDLEKIERKAEELKARQM